MHCKLATKQLKAPKLLRKNLEQEGAAFWVGAKSGFWGAFPKSFARARRPPPKAALRAGEGHLSLKQKLKS
jgi:hypothetical protein